MTVHCWKLHDKVVSTVGLRPALSLPHLFWVTKPSIPAHPESGQNDKLLCHGSWTFLLGCFLYEGLMGDCVHTVYITRSTLVAGFQVNPWLTVSHSSSEGVFFQCLFERWLSVGLMPSCQTTAVSEALNETPTIDPNLCPHRLRIHYQTAEGKEGRITSALIVVSWPWQRQYHSWVVLQQSEVLSSFYVFPRPSSPLQKGAQQPPTFRPMSVVAKCLDGSGNHLVRR